MSVVEPTSAECPNCGAGVDYTWKEGVFHEVISCSYCGTKLKIRYEQPAASDFHGRDMVFQMGHRPVVNVETYRRALLPLILGIVVIFVAIGLAVPLFILHGVKSTVTQFISDENTGINFPAASSRDYICEGGQRLILNDRTVKNSTGIIASGNCQVIISNSIIKSDTTVITASDNARVTISNSRLFAQKTGIVARGAAKMILANSTVDGGHTGIFAEGRARVRLANSVLRGNEFAYRKTSAAQVILVNTKTVGHTEN